MAKRIKEADDTEVKFGDEAEETKNVSEAKRRKSRIKEADEDELDESEDEEEAKTSESKRSKSFRKFIKEAGADSDELDEAEDDEDAKVSEAKGKKKKKIKEADEDEVNESDEDDLDESEDEDKSVNEGKKGRKIKEADEDELDEEDEDKVDESEDEEDAKVSEAKGKKKKKIKEADEDELDEEDEEDKALEEARKAVPVLSEAEIASHVNVLFEGANLSDDFKSKASVILESAVNSAIAEQSKALNEANEKYLAKKTERIESRLVESVDSYLTEAAKQWISENRLAVERGLMLEQAQSFMSGLRKLFLEHNINVPAGQENLVEAQAAKIERLKTRLNEEIEGRLTVTKALNEAKKEIALNKLTEGLSVVDSDKLRKLAEGLDGSLDVSAFESKVKVLKESYTNKSAAKPLNESVRVPVTGSSEIGSDDPLVARTLSALSKKHS